MLPVALAFPLDLFMPVLTQSYPDLSSLCFPRAQSIGPVVLGAWEERSCWELGAGAVGLL